MPLNYIQQNANPLKYVTESKEEKMIRIRNLPKRQLNIQILGDWN